MVLWVGVRYISYGFMCGCKIYTLCFMDGYKGYTLWFYGWV